MGKRLFIFYFKDIFNIKDNLLFYDNKKIANHEITKNMSQYVKYLKMIL